jgi:DNA-binding response OmpR family regulator
MILVIDDELETIELIQAAFKRSGCRVLGAMNGHEGLRLAREHRPAIILIDLMLPGLDGFELCRQLRDDSTTEHIPRVILSARDSLADQADALAAGADRYVVKPVGMKALIGLVEGLIGQPNAAANES